jgi:hypothetical protein
MTPRLSLFLVPLALIACTSPHKAEVINTQVDGAATVSGNQVVGVKDGKMVVMDKEQMSERLRDLQNSVFSLEDKVYGTRKLNTLGLYGDLKSCQRRMASRQFGGSGNMVWAEPLDRVTDKEQEFKAGVDEKKELVGVSEEYLKDRLTRFQGYRTILQKRYDEFASQIEACKGQLASREMDASQPTKVMVQEVSKANFDKTNINQFMCGFVKKGASLQSFMVNAFAKGWLSLNDYRMEQNLIAASLKDSKGSSRDNALLFSGWKLSFDRSPVTVGELLNDGKDAQLSAWAYDKRGDGADGASCLAKSEGEWNP